MNEQSGFWLPIFMLTLPALLGALSMDMLLPVLPDMAISMRLSSSQIQWMLNIFILGFALCQLLVGVAATRFSDRQLFLAAVILFILSSACIALVNSYSGILVLRFLQALSSCTILVISMALITQSFSASKVTKGHSVLSGITSLGPLLAPMIGVALLKVGADWRGIFWILALAGCMVLLLFLRSPQSIHWRSKPAIRQYYGKIINNPVFWQHAIYSSVGMCWIFLFFSTAPFIVYDFYLQGQWALALMFSFAAGAFVFGSYIGAILQHEKGADRHLRQCLVVKIVFSVALICITIFYELPFYGYVSWVIMMQLNCGLYFGPAISAALQKFPKTPVQAAAFQGFQQFFITFMVTSLLLLFFGREPHDLSMMILIVSCLAMSAVLTVKIKYGV